jgi:hypothetical protein
MSDLFREAWFSFCTGKFEPLEAAAFPLKYIENGRFGVAIRHHTSEMAGTQS